MSPRITIKEQLLAIIQAHTAEMITGFEGAEKILQIKTVSVKPNDGLRSVSREEWSRILDVAKSSQHLQIQ